MKNYKVGDRVKIVASTLQSDTRAASYIGREVVIKQVFEYDDSLFSIIQTDYDVAVIGEAHDDLSVDELPGYNHSDLELVV